MKTQNPINPQGFCNIHKLAVSRLTDEWQRFSQAWGQFNAFDDLVAWGMAEVKREPILRHGLQCGEKTFFKLA